MTKDSLFAHPQKPVPPFEFNESVVQVFDDMLNRSVPCYRELIRRQAQMAVHFHQTGTRIYDLGCSTGNMGLAIRAVMDETRSFEWIGVDTSAPMLKVCRERMQSAGGHAHVTLQCADIRDLEMTHASVIILNLTLQFVPPTDRAALLERIFDALVPGGILLLTEKVVHPHPLLDALQQSFYYRFKAENGYSRMEVSQKREALENVLIPETIEQHLARLQRVGFRACDVWLKWFNFASLLALKEAP
jgi:tRNA (cmo5U34)-methyltransferase